MSNCPCGSGQTFEACCGPILGGAPAPTAEALSRNSTASGNTWSTGHNAAKAAALVLIVDSAKGMASDRGNFADVFRSGSHATRSATPNRLQSLL